MHRKKLMYILDIHIYKHSKCRGKLKSNHKIFYITINSKPMTNKEDAFNKKVTFEVLNPVG